MPFSKMLEKKPGKMVTISKRIQTNDIGTCVPPVFGRGGLDPEMLH
jgi:hypothetical protein